MYAFGLDDQNLSFRLILIEATIFTLLILVKGLSRHKNQCAHWYLFHVPIDKDIYILFEMRNHSPPEGNDYFLIM